MKSIDKPVIIEQSFEKPIEAVWQAISQLDQMRQWFFNNIPAFLPEAGFELQFNVQSGERNFLHQWKLLEVSPPQKIVYNWSYKEYPGNAMVSFELFEGEKGTLLRLTHIVTIDFPQDIPEFKRASCIGGWAYFIQNRLKAYLDK